MRTSSQLRKTDTCEYNPNTKLNSVSPVIRDAGVQKGVLLRLLRGEPVDNIASELESSYTREGKIWETDAQLTGTLMLQSKRIERLAKWELTSQNRQNKRFLKDITADGANPIIVSLRGENIEARPDYIVENRSRVYVCKVKTGRFRPDPTESVSSQEALALGLAGEKLYPDKEVVVQYLYLGDRNDVAERTSLALMDDIPYDTTDTKYNKIMERIFNREMKQEIQTLYENEDHTCKPEDCAACSMNNICNYTEAPIPAPASDSVRPLGDIRLSHDQEAVIDYDHGTARVNAGPGSGKTLVTSLHFERLIEKGYDPKKFCLLTFTNAGAGEMTARTIAYAAEKSHPVDPDNLTSTTFNAFCQMIIDDNYEQLGFTRKPRVIDDASKRGLINRILDQFPRMTNWTYTGSAATERVFRKDSSSIAYIRASREFEEIKKEGYTKDNYPTMWNKTYSPDEIRILFMMYDEFNHQLKKKNYLEFDDQIKYIEQLSEANPDLFEQLGYEHIVVDEFQDTDYPQIKLLQKLRDTTCFKSLMCVGDDSQSIFAFRHTSPEYMVNFSNYFGHFDDFSLVENHRSNRATITFANKINDLANLKVDKELIATKDEGLVPKVKGFYSEKSEYAWIADEIKKRWDNGQRDIAVIMSDRNQLVKMADALTKLRIPSVLKSPVPMVSNSRIRALVSFYDAFMGHSSQGFIDYKNILEGGGLKGKAAQELEDMADSFKNEVLSHEKTKTTFIAFAEKLDLAENDECYQKFLERFKDCDNISEISEVMENFKLFGKDEMFKREGRYDGVNLTTIHSSKGLEWDITFLCVDKLDDPKYHERRQFYIDKGEYDEVIRKMFVGSTRAREELVITGNYILKINQKDNYLIFNDLLRKSYEIVNKVWDYTYSDYEAVRASEKEQLINESLKGTEMAPESISRVLPASHDHTQPQEDMEIC